MADAFRKSFDIKDSGLELRVDVFGEFIPKEKLKINKTEFEKMCKEGCPKYGKHYGCHPGSPDFEDYTERAKYFLALMFCVQSKGKDPEKFDEIETEAYPEIDMILRKMEKASGTKHIAARSCKICVPCLKEKNLPCKNPEKRRNCTVSLGIDCQDIAENIFHKALVWQKGENLKGYTSFICLVPMKSLEEKEILVKILDEEANKVARQ